MHYISQREREEDAQDRQSGQETQTVFPRKNWCGCLFSMAGAYCNQETLLSSQKAIPAKTPCAQDGRQAGQAKSFSDIADAPVNQSRAENVFCHQESGARLEVREVEEPWCFAELLFSTPETGQLQGFAEKSVLSLEETKIDTRYLVP